MSAKRNYPAWMAFPISTVGGCGAWFAVHPMDVIKVRMQLAGEATGPRLGAMGTVKSIMAQRGFIGLYEGISAGIARQVVYATARLGFYDVFRDILIGGDEKGATMLQRILAGAMSGGCAAYMSCPVEVSLVRMQGDGRLPVAERRCYKHVFDALFRIYREEGVLTFWRGATPTVCRAMMVGITQVAFYDQCRTWLIMSGYSCFTTTSLSTTVIASLLTGLFYSFATMPIETVKVRMQSQKPLPDGTLRYKGIVQALFNIGRSEGVKSLYNGYSAYYGRCAGHTIACFVLVDQCKKLLNWAYEK